jgi:hypothetical protein
LELGATRGQLLRMREDLTVPAERAHGPQHFCSANDAQPQRPYVIRWLACELLFLNRSVLLLDPSRSYVCACFVSQSTALTRASGSEAEVNPRERETPRCDARLITIADVQCSGCVVLLIG